MAEEIKETKEVQKTDGGKIFKTLLKVLLGLILLAIGLILAWIWRTDLLVLIRGGFGLFLILAGVITLAIAKE